MAMSIGALYQAGAATGWLDGGESRRRTRRDPSAAMGVISQPQSA
jgi:hypothetical protein